MHDDSGRRGGRGPRGSRFEQETPSADGLEGWFAGRLPDGWFEGTPEITVDRDEVTVVGRLASPAPSTSEDGVAVAAAEAGRIARFREETREQRMTIAQEAERRYGRQVAWGAQAGRIHQFREDTRDDRIRVALQVEHRYQRKVSWGVRCGDTQDLFTHLSAPVMTRLRQPERLVLDTLVDAGVARSRSEALAWCVKLVGEHTDDWLTELRDAMTKVEDLRRRGPNAA